MNFLTLWDDQLDTELGSEDTTQRFTAVRRKAAINEGQTEFIERTECLIVEVTIAVVDGTAEYDLETSVTDLIRVAKGGPSLKKLVTATSAVSYVEGPDDFPRKDPPLQKRLNPGYRANTASTPSSWYQRRDMGRLYLGLNPPPDIPSTETWSLLVPCVVRAADMSASGDEPFTRTGGTAPDSLIPWHKALVHWAAAQLEKLRKDPIRQQAQERKFQEYVARYVAQDRPKGGRMVQLAHNYRTGIRAGGFVRRTVDADTVT